MGSVLVDVIKNQYQCQSCHDPSDTYGDTKLITKLLKLYVLVYHKIFMCMNYEYK